MNKYFVIGDIHGCINQLNEILEIKRNYPEHKMVFLGDYIDRGPASDSVCRKVASLNAICLAGNHETMLLSRIKRHPEQKEQTLMLAVMSEISLKWIAGKLDYIFEDDDYIFVHAGLDINKSMSQQTEQDYLWTIYDGDYYQLTKKIIVHGHVVVQDPVIKGNRININTGCGSGGYLTALVLPEMNFYKSSISPGKEYNWDKIRKELEEDIQELEIENG